jgi:serine/threonine protein kinase
VVADGDILDGKYEIRGRLGGGGMGEVYLARRTMLGDEVAVKLVRPTGPDSAEWRARFLREARASAQLRHPNIVAVLDFNIAQGDQPYLVLEYLNGPNLAQELRARGRFDLAGAMHVLRAVGAGLQLAHSIGLVHRDLKLQNVVSHRYQSGEVVHKVIDFGLVSLRPGDDETPLTEAHEFLGTVAYAAPEQFTGARADARSDQYSLGVIAYELLAGVRPIEADSFMALADRLLNARPRPLREHRPDLPAHVANAVMRALEKDPDRRWPNVAAFIAALGDDDDTHTTAMPLSSVSGLLGAYELGPVIAKGRFGSEIHSGVHRALGVPVAIRLLRVAGRDNAGAMRDRFLKEARALQVPHPNLLQVRDFGDDGEQVYLVTDLLEGVSLAERLKDGPLPLDVLDRFVSQIADATSALNRKEALISGLHPGIVRVVADGGEERVVLSTAGVSAIRDVLATLDEATLRAQAGNAGELPYVAPELLMGRPADRRSDVFTIGVLAYEMATGRRPYAAGSLPELIGAVMSGPPESPVVSRTDLSHTKAAAIMQALASDPAARPADATRFLNAWAERAAK